MADDIVERLRNGYHSLSGRPVVEDAADEIERLRAENARSLKGAKHAARRIGETHRQIDGLRAEIERLRGWIDRLEPMKTYEATICPMCQKGTEYRSWQEPEPHVDGCPWRERARIEGDADAS